MDGCPLGLGLVVEDKPTEFSCCLCIRSLTLDCVDDEALQTLCSGILKLRYLDLSNSSITDQR